MICDEKYYGEFHESFGIPAHTRCVTRQTRCSFEDDLNLGAAEDFVVENIPHNSISGFGSTWHTLWKSQHPAIPAEHSVEGFVAKHTAKIAEIKAKACLAALI